MSKTITVDPAALPALDIITLANQGAILRAEAQTAPDAIPLFVTSQGWAALQQRYDATRPEDAPTLLARLERATAKLMTHVAQGVAKAGTAPATLTCPSDFFTPDGHVVIAFVRDETHPVACAIIGAKDHIDHLLRG